MTESKPKTKSLNVEITTHNYYFHEQASIFSVTSLDNHIITAGGDNDLRVWKVIDEKLSKSKKESSNEGLEIGDNVIDEQRMPLDVAESSNNIVPQEDRNLEIDVNEEAGFNYKILHKYTTALNSSIKLEFSKELKEHNKSVNCVRVVNKNIIVSCSDGGKIIAYNDIEHHVVREQDGKDIYDMVCYGKLLFAGISNGFVNVYEITEDEKIRSECIQSIEVHNEIIQGLAYNPVYNLLVVFFKDKTAKSFIFDKVLEHIYTFDFFNKDIFCYNGIYSITAFDKKRKDEYTKKDDDVVESNLPLSTNKLKQNLEGTDGRQEIDLNSDSVKKIKLNSSEKIPFSVDNGSQEQVDDETMKNSNEVVRDRIFTAGRGFFKRTCFSEDGNLLYLCCCKSNSVFVLSYPFRIEHTLYKIGPLNGDAVCIKEHKGFLYICTRKSVYIFKNFTLLFCIENLTFMAITDICFVNDIVFVSSLDGFVASFRITNNT